MLDVLREQENRNLNRLGDEVERLVKVQMPFYLGCIGHGGTEEAERAMDSDLNSLFVQGKLKMYRVRAEHDTAADWYKLEWVYKTSHQIVLRTFTHVVSAEQVRL